MKLVCRHAARLRSREVAADAWKKTTNSAWYHLIELDRAVRGEADIDATTPIPAPEQMDPQAWDRLRETLCAVEQAVDFLNLVLVLEGGGAPEFDSPQQAIEALRRDTQWIRDSGQAARHPMARAAVLEILDDLPAIAVTEALLERHREDGLVGVECRPVLQAEMDPDAHFDVFVSYKHRRYANEASELSAALQARGLKVWFDREQLRLPADGVVPPGEIARLLIHAVRQSALMVFFETYDEARADHDHRGRGTVYNWQVLEQRYGTRIITVHPERQTLAVEPAQAVAYASVNDLVEAVALCRARIAQGNPGSPGPDAVRDEECSYDEAVSALQAQASRHFGAATTVSAQANAALLPPRPLPAEPGVPLGNDVLVALLRQSAWSARALTAAGVDAESVLYVGAQAAFSRWSMPGARRLEDVFGSGRSGGVRLDGLLDEGVLLLGLLAFAAEGAQAASLLGRAQRLQGDIPEAQPAHDTAAARRVHDRVLDVSEASGQLAFADQQWEIWREAGRWRVRPCASCGLWRMPDPALRSGEEKLTSVVVTQTQTFYTQDDLDRLEDLVNAGSGGALQSFLGQRPHLSIGLAIGQWTVAEVIDLMPPVPGIDRVALHRLESLDGSPFVCDASRGGRLMALISSVAPDVQETAAPVQRLGPFVLRRRRVLVLGAPPRPRGPDASIESIPFRELAVTVLPPLCRYLRIRDVDPSVLGA